MTKRTNNNLQTGQDNTMTKKDRQQSTNRTDNTMTKRTNNNLQTEGQTIQ